MRFAFVQRANSKVKNKSMRSIFVSVAPLAVASWANCL
jgi:hypothetical protein